MFYDIGIYTIDKSSFSLTDWTSASRATWNGENWILTNGWTRSLNGEGEDNYEAFETRVYPQMNDGPDHFKKEVRVASQMTYLELRSYIDDLAISGFDVRSLTVDLNRKLSFPLVTFIMAMIAIPFSFTTGRRGAFYGIGISIGIGIGYWGGVRDLRQSRRNQPVVADDSGLVSQPDLRVQRILDAAQSPNVKKNAGQSVAERYGVLPPTAGIRSDPGPSGRILTHGSLQSRHLILFLPGEVSVFTPKVSVTRCFRIYWTA